MNVPVEAAGTGLLNLPNEILLSIVDTYIDALDSPDLQARQTKLAELSHVCRKLRGVIVGCPKYWNTICSGLHREDRMQTFLTRSAGMDINVVLMDKHGEEACEALMRIASKVPGRWRSFSLIVTSNGDPQYSFTRTLRRLDCYLLYLQLPRLRNLRVHYGSPPSSFTHDFFTTWSFNGLRSMDLTNIAPKVAPMSLTSFSMTFRKGRDTVSLPLLQYFIESSNSLDKLSLTFESDMLVRVARGRIAPVANVRSLRLKVENTGVESICPVLRAFTFPKLDELSVVARFHHMGQVAPMGINDWKSNIFDACDSFYRVSSLTLSLCDYGMLHDGILSPLSSRFSNLKHFSLETNLVVLIVGAEGNNVEWPSKPLETISFTECETFDIAWLQELKALLGRKDHWEGLNKLRIEECDKLNYDEVLDLISTEKLEWSEARSTPKEAFSELIGPRFASQHHHHWHHHPLDIFEDDDMDGDYFDDVNSWGFWSEYSGSDGEYLDDGHEVIDPDDNEVGVDEMMEGDDPYMEIPGAFIHNDPEDMEEDEDQQDEYWEDEYAPDFEGPQGEEDYDPGAASDEGSGGEGYDEAYAQEYYNDDVGDHQNPYLVYDHSMVEEGEQEDPDQADPPVDSSEPAGSEHGSEEHHGAYTAVCRLLQLIADLNSRRLRCGRRLRT